MIDVPFLRQRFVEIKAERDELERAVQRLEDILLVHAWTATQRRVIQITKGMAPEQVRVLVDEVFGGPGAQWEPILFKSGVASI